MEHLVEKMKTTVKRGLILRCEGTGTTIVSIIINFAFFLWAYCSLFNSTFVLEMRNATQTTLLTLSSTCIRRRERVCLTAGRMCLAICNRCAKVQIVSLLSHYFSTTFMS